MALNEVFPYSPPFLEDGAAVIVFDCGRAVPAIWDATASGFHYAANQQELAEEGLAVVLEQFPSIVRSSKSMRVFMCPRELLVRCQFDWSHRGSASSR